MPSALINEEAPLVQVELQLALRAAELRREKELLVKAKKLRDAYGINFYRPHWKQHKFHTCDATGRYGRTGNRFGKSEMGIAEDIAWCYGGRVWYREAFDVIDGERVVREQHPGGRDHPFVTRGIPRHPVKGLLLVVDWDMADKVFTNQTNDTKTCGKLFKFLPKDAIGKVHLSRGGHVDKVEVKRPTEFGGGISTLTIDTIESWKHNKLGGESADWDFIHVDEPVPEAMFKSYARGLMDRNGKYWFTCTPLDQMWINDKFIPDARLKGDTSEGVREGDHYVITGSIYDNPYRNPAGVAEFESGLTDDEKQCRLHGVPLAMAGLVYKEFQYDEHVLSALPKGWKEWHQPPANYTIRVAWDVCGARRPQAFLYAATAPDNSVFVYDEQYYEPLIAPNLDLMKKKVKGYYVADQLVDPLAMVKSPVTDTCPILDLAAEYELYFDAGSKDKVTGISTVKERLMERGQVSNKPTIFFSPKLKRTLYELTHYSYDVEKNEPREENNDQMENLRRLLLTGCSYIEPPNDADYVRVQRAVVPHDAYHTSKNTFSNGR